MLTDDEVRDLFSAYHDRELSPERTEAVRAALDASPPLQREYAAFGRMLDGLSAMAAAAEAPLHGASAPKAADAPKDAPPPDLLGGVQRRLQKLVSDGVLAKRGARKNAVYTLAGRDGSG